jgi:hypothetical protein
MGNIVQLFDTKRPQPVRPTAAAKLKEVNPNASEFTFDDLKRYNYRGMFGEVANRQRHPKAAAKLLQQQFRTVDLAYGALIAIKLKNDQEAAVFLTKLFSQLVASGTEYGTLADLPELVRGYVWGYYPILTAYARAFVSVAPPA